MQNVDLSRKTPRSSRLWKELCKLGATCTMTKSARACFVSNSTEDESGMCEKYARQVAQNAYPTKSDDCFLGTAKKSGEAFQGTKFDVTGTREEKPGDLLYYTRLHGPNGHVVILMEGGLVMENSMLHRENGDCRGMRRRAELDEPDVVVDYSL